MTTVAVLLVLGVAFAVFALLGSAERARMCERGRAGDPRCEHCFAEAEHLALNVSPPMGADDGGGCG